MAKHQNYWFESYAPVIQIRSGVIKNADVLIIGGGIAGLLTLWQMIKAKQENVYLLDESTPGYRASGRSSGQLMLRGARSFTDVHHSISPVAANEYMDFIAANNEILRTVIDDSQLQCDLRESGGLRLAVDDVEMSALEEEAELIENAGVGVTPVMLNRNEVQNLVYSKRFVGGMYIASEATFNPYMLTNRMAEKLDAGGKRILTGCSVESVTENDDGILEVKIRDKGIVRAKKVIYCTNAYTPRLLPEFAPFMSSFRGQIIASDKLPEQIQKIMPQMSMSCNYGREYFRVHRERMLMGGMRHKVRGSQRGIMFDGEASRAVGQHLRDFMSQAFPYITNAPTHIWTGVMSATADGFPMVGPVPGKPNQYVCAGFNGYGFSHTLLSAYAIKDFVLQNKTAVPAVSLFDPARAIVS
jgi:glycine/D-amino acid oxidase-like deaminating enzyme